MTGTTPGFVEHPGLRSEHLYLMTGDECREYLWLLLAVLKPDLPSITWLRHAVESVAFGEHDDRDVARAHSRRWAAPQRPPERALRLQRARPRQAPPPARRKEPSAAVVHGSRRPTPCRTGARSVPVGPDARHAARYRGARARQGRSTAYEEVRRSVLTLPPRLLCIGVPTAPMSPATRAIMAAVDRSELVSRSDCGPWSR
jgi:hypothetical protein